MINFRYFKMARGQQKIQAQEKANEKAAKLKKAAGNNVHDNKKVMDRTGQGQGKGHHYWIGRNTFVMNFILK